MRRSNTFLSRVPPITLQLMVATSGATLLCIIAAHLGLPQLLEAFLFQPYEVVPGLKIWKLISYLFVSGTDPLGFLLELLVLYFFGAWFERSWGARRFLIFYLISGAGATLLPLALGLFSPTVAHTHYYGNWAVLEALTVAMGLLQPEAQVYFYFVVPVKARHLMYLSWALLILLIVFDGSPVPYLAAVGGIGMGLLLTLRAGGLRRFWLRFQAGRIERQLRRRAQHLRVVPRERHDGSESDKKTYLH